MSKQVTTVTLKDGTERVYESYPVEDYDALRAENERLRGALEAIASCAPDGFATYQECNADMRRWAQEALAGVAP